MHHRPVHLWFVFSLILAALPAVGEILVQGRVGDAGGPPPAGVRVRLEPFGDR